MSSSLLGARAAPSIATGSWPVGDARPFRPHPAARRTRVESSSRVREGFTLLELMVVLVIVGVMFSMALRPLTLQRNKANARSARVMVSQGLATARAAAVARGCVSVLHLQVTANVSNPNGKMWVTSCKATTIGRATAAVDTLGRIDTLSRHFSVTVTGSADSIMYDSRGFSVNYASGGFAFSGGTNARDTLTITTMGRVAQ